MAEPALPTLLNSPASQTFPTLTPAQIARIAAHGSVRPVRGGEVLVEAGGQPVPFFVVKAGRLEIVRNPGPAETLVAVHAPGQFTGEVNMLSGRRSLFQARAAEPGEVIELDHDKHAGARADRLRAQRDLHAGVHLSPAGADRARASETSCSSARSIPRERCASGSS